MVSNSPMAENPTNTLPLKTLVLVLGGLAALAMGGYIWISAANNVSSADALLGICSAIVGYLGGLLTPGPSVS
jgi:hypothetical protein